MKIWVTTDHDYSSLELPFVAVHADPEECIEEILDFYAVDGLDADTITDPHKNEWEYEVGERTIRIQRRELDV